MATDSSCRPCASFVCFASAATRRWQLCTLSLHLFTFFSGIPPLAVPRAHRRLGRIAARYCRHALRIRSPFPGSTSSHPSVYLPAPAMLLHIPVRPNTTILLQSNPTHRPLTDPRSSIIRLSSQSALRHHLVRQGLATAHAHRSQMLVASYTHPGPAEMPLSKAR